MNYPSIPVSKPQPSGIQERIARIYYSHGLFCSSHPYSVILVTLGILGICCYPLLHLPLLGSSSQHFTTPAKGFVSPQVESGSTENSKITGPRWFDGQPVGYVQQIVVKISVSPWRNDLIVTDAFRAPLAEAFHINELINNHHIVYRHDNSTNLGDICLQVSEPIDKLSKSVLPHYSCLLVSPASIWKHDFNMFQQDADIVKTIFSQKDSSLDSSTIREILFGVPWKETGIKKYYIRNRPRVITYAFTIVTHSFNTEFLHSLFNQLRMKYPTTPYLENVTFIPEEGVISHIYFQDMHHLAEFIPLVLAYIILFLYIYFSVRKIELVKSKWALAISAVMTVVMSLLMSVGLCLWFGLSPTLNGSEILPYLIVVIGLENMLVLTKSIVSTPMHLDVKLRVAQGLSKEGWSITKNLLTELALLTVAFLTFVPKIQEFCLFAVVGLLTDFFLQLVFFATFLSIDIRRIEISDLHRNSFYQNLDINQRHSNLRLNEVSRSSSKQIANSKLPQSRNVVPQTKRKGSVTSTDNSAKVFAHPTNPVFVKLPKRLKFIYFWARTRMVQRGLMVCLVVWIIFFIYTSGIVERLTDNAVAFKPISKSDAHSTQQVDSDNLNSSAVLPSEIMDVKVIQEDQVNPEIVSKNIGLKHRNLDLWQSLSPQYWTTLFGYYNISLSGRYISILPPLHLSVPIDPDTAIQQRTAADAEISKKSQWQFLSSVEQKKDIGDLSSDLLYHPSSPGEVALAIALAIPTFLFFVYLMVVLYRCMCTKHYAEWRSSWRNSTTNTSELAHKAYGPVGASDAYLVMETLPVKLQKHSEELELIVADNSVIVSTCLAGDICVWDAISGECLTLIKRSRCSKSQKKNYSREHTSFSSDSTYSSSPQSDGADSVICNSSTPLTPSSTSYPESSFIKQFSFDENSFCSTDQNFADKKYDFSKYVNSKEHFSDDYCNDMACNKSCSKLNHESQIYHQHNHEEYKVNNCEFLSNLPFQPLWSLWYSDSCIGIGCKDGRLEVWNAFSGQLIYAYEGNKSGVTALRIANGRLVSAHLNGTIDFFIISDKKNSGSCFQDKNADASFDNIGTGTIQCSWLQSIKAHNLAVSALEIDNSFVVSGGYDRLIKVFKSDTAVCLYTFHGHTAPISALHIDKFSLSSATSGCQDGLICSWDLMTGTCIYSLNGHRGTVVALKATTMYIVSQGTDNCICIWEKCQGHLLHSISQEFVLHSAFILLSNNIMVTTKEDNLVLWDVNHGEALRMIMVGNGDHSCNIRLLSRSGQSVICDYGPQMFIINFPAVSDKSD